jgi:hypothetical protein
MLSGSGCSSRWPGDLTGGDRDMRTRIEFRLIVMLVIAALLLGLRACFAPSSQTTRVRPAQRR